MAHMQSATGIGEHGKTIEFVSLVVLRYSEAIVGKPMCLCSFFNGSRVIWLFRHVVRPVGREVEFHLLFEITAGKKERRILAAIAQGCDGWAAMNGGR